MSAHAKILDNESKAATENNEEVAENNAPKLPSPIPEVVPISSSDSTSATAAKSTALAAEAKEMSKRATKSTAVEAEAKETSAVADKPKLWIDPKNPVE